MNPLLKTLGLILIYVLAGALIVLVLVLGPCRNDSASFTVSVLSEDPNVRSELFVTIDGREKTAESGTGSWTASPKVSLKSDEEATVSLRLPIEAEKTMLPVPEGPQRVTNGSTVYFRIEKISDDLLTKLYDHHLRDAAVQAPAEVSSELVLVRADAESMLARGQGPWSQRLDVPLKSGTEGSAVLRVLPAGNDKYTITPKQVDIRGGANLAFKVAEEDGNDGESGSIVLVQTTYQVRVTSDDRPEVGTNVTSSNTALGPDAVTDDRGIAELSLQGNKGTSFRIKVTTLDGRSKSSGTLTLRRDGLDSLSFRLGHANTTHHYTVRVLRYGQGVNNATVTSSAGGTRAITSGEGEASFDLTLPEGTSVSFRAKDGSDGGTSTAVIHSAEGSASTFTITLSKDESTTVTYVARALRRDNPGTAPVPLQGVGIRIRGADRTELASGLTKSDGLVSLRVNSEPGAQLTVKADPPADLSGEYKPYNVESDVFAHTPYPDTLRFSWGRSASKIESTCESIDKQVPQLLENGWAVAFMLLKNLPGKYGTRESAKNSAAVKTQYRALTDRLRTISTDLSTANCTAELRAEVSLAGMLAAASLGNVAACDQEYARYQDLPYGVTVTRNAAAHLYRALALTVEGVMDPASKSAEATNLLDKCEMYFEQADELTRNRIGGRRYAVRAAISWQQSSPIGVTNPGKLLADAQTYLQRWRNWCDNSADCPDGPYIQELSTAIDR